MNFKDKKVLIMGLGIQGGGAGAARFFAEHGAKVTVTDLKTEKELERSLKELKSLKSRPKFILGKHRQEDFKNADLVIRNPDVPRDSPFLKIARDNDVPVEMDASLFMKLCPNRNNIIGVTGTRGKTTTTHLIAAILKKAGFDVLMGGNLRGAATLSLLDKITPQTKIVLELSSWQLQGLNSDKISPHVAVMTNIYPDHLNRYKNMEEYIEDKKTIYRFQDKDDYLLLNRKMLKQVQHDILRETKSKVVWFSQTDIVHLGGVLRTPPRWLKGGHNLENLAAAYTAAKILKIDDKTIREGVEGFEGVEFRLQEIAEIDGVTYVNDTTSTAPIATIMALKAYQDRKIILICGGSSKNLKMDELAIEIKKRVKAVVLLEGAGTDEIEKSLKVARFKSSKVLGRFDNFEKAILVAKNAAKSSDIVLLSPACASFGMFINEFDRGEKFNEIIQGIKTKEN